MNRRDFLKGATLTSLSLRAPIIVPQSVQGANEKVVLGVIGVRGRGRGLAEAFAGLPHATVKTVCDVDARVLPRVIRDVEQKQHRAPEMASDFRRLLEDREIDAVVVATPDHWHALITILACQAGKDVYVEKPISHNIVEGRRMVEAARYYKRIVQSGTQRRSSPFFQEAIATLRSGRLGKIYLAKALNSQRRANIGRKTDSPPPAEVNYDLWLGPAPKRPFNENRFHYNWHWFWDYGTGDLGNDGVHHVDVARWGLGVSKPHSVQSGGGKLFFEDDQETPDTQIVTYQFEGCTLVYEMRLWSPYGEHNMENGNVFYGEKGFMILGDTGWQIFGPKNVLEESRKATERGDTEHLRHFLTSVKERKTPPADVEEGHYSALLCHLGNIAHRTGHSLRFHPTEETFRDDPTATRLLSRTYRKPWNLPKIG